jgi:hypothetical protein
MKRTFLLVLLALTITSLTTAAAYAELPNGQTTRSGSRGLLYPSPLLLIIFRYMLWRKMRAEQDKQWGASDEQWGASKQTPKQRSNGLRSIVIFAVIFITAVVVGNHFLSNNRGGERVDQAAPGPTLAPVPAPVPVAPERHVAVKRGYLGVKIHDIDAELAAKVGVKEGAGVQITHMSDQSPAVKCGLQVNDIILTIADKPVHGGIELQKLVSGLPLDQAVDVVISRGGKSLKLRLTIEEPDKFGSNPPKSKE